MNRPATPTVRTRPPPAVTPPPRWALWAAYATALVTVPSGLYRIAMGLGVPVGYSDQVLREEFGIPGAGVAYVIGLSVLSQALALLTLGLVKSWGETVPGWIPFLGGRRFAPLAAVTYSYHRRHRRSR